jgi:hypothetical protein
MDAGALYAWHFLSSWWKVSWILNRNLSTSD